VVAVLEEPEAGAAAGEETGPEPGEAPEETGVDGGEAREITLARGRPAPPSPGGRSEPARSRGSVAAAPPAAAAAASPRARATARAYADGLAAFRARDYPRSAAAWREMLAGIEPDLATIQLALNCAFENVLKNQQALDGKASFYALPYRHQGKACHLSFTGLYRNREEAGLALAELPATVREEKPRVVTIGEARRRLEGQ
jgi:septal ring-binding cell division protein DamX